MGLFLIIFFILFCELQTQNVPFKSKNKGSDSTRVGNNWRNHRKSRAISDIRRIQQRLDVLEVRQNAEMQYRKEDTEHIYEKISGIEQILNTSLIAMEQDKNENWVSARSQDDFRNTDEVISIEDYRSLKKGFVNEKRLNSKLRENVRKIKNDIAKCSVDKKATKENFANISKQFRDMDSYTELIPIVNEENRRLSEELKHVKDTLAKQQAVLDMVLSKVNASSNQGGSKSAKNVENSETKEGIEIQQKKSKQYAELNPGEVNQSSCQDFYQQGFRTSGIYKIQLSKRQFMVYCDQQTDGGGWTVFQRRYDGSVDFNRTWKDYKYGFGDLKGEFWLGNKYLHQMTYIGLHELRIELCDWTNTTKYAKYSSFNISPESGKYSLRVSGHSGTVEDSFAEYHTGQVFGTFDKHSNRLYQDYISSCAQQLGGGWWFKSCSLSNLNGKYIAITDGRHYDPSRGIHWYSWGGYSYSMKFTEMKFR